LLTLRRANEDTILSSQPMTVFIEVLLVVRGAVAVRVVKGRVAPADDSSVPRDVPGRWFGPGLPSAVGESAVGETANEHVGQEQEETVSG